MPVWHERTRELRESGALTVIGILQEQHPERAELYAQWQGFDWPLLWDPFNLTDAEVVLNAYLIGADGVVWKAGARPEDLEEFLALQDWNPDGLANAFEFLGGPPSLSESQSELFPDEREYLSSMLWRTDPAPFPAMRRYLSASEPVLRASFDPVLAFRRGVVARLLLDAGASDDGLFQLATDSWASALAARPTQYIWRRRLQQYGPQLDKPYPFYDWVETARAELLARGETPLELPAALTPTERLGRRAIEASAGVEPDPDAKLPTDGRFEVDATFVADTQGRERVCAHLTFAPLEGEDAKWNDEAGPIVVWIDGAEGVVDAQRIELGPTGDERSRRTVSLDLTPKADATLRGYAVLQVCEADVCRAVRLSFAFEVPKP